MVRPVIGIIGNPHLINSEYLVHGVGEMNSRRRAQDLQRFAGHRPTRCAACPD
jgi:hypothetical protein